MDTSCEVDLGVSVTTFNGIEFPCLTVVFPPENINAVEVAEFAPAQLQVTEEEPNHMELVQDGGHVIAAFSGLTSEGEVDEQFALFRSLLESTCAFVLVMLSPTGAVNDPTLVARILVYENITGRLAADSNPMRVPVEELRDRINNPPTDEVPDISKLTDVDGPVGLAKVLDYDGTNINRLLNPDPTKLN